MLVRTSWLAAAVVLASGGVSPADEAHYFDKDGMTYLETRQVVSHPVTETRIEQRESLSYRPKYTSELKETQRNYMAPVTEYQWVPYVQGRWNPFATPSLNYRLVPQTRWEPRVETVRIPVTRCEMVPEKHVVQVPVTTARIAQGEIVTRVPVRTSGSSATAAGGSLGSPHTTVGGVSKLESDPPRQSSNWRSADTNVQR